MGVAGVALGTAGAMLEHLMALAMAKTPRGQALLADDAVVQAEVARASAKLGAARGLAARHARRDARRGRAASPLSDGGARPAAAGLRPCDPGGDRGGGLHLQAAGVDAIFPGSPFERRFRDIHTLSQQIQSRAAHFAAVGQVLLGRAPPGFL